MRNPQILPGRYTRLLIYGALALYIGLILGDWLRSADKYNGFDVTNSTIDPAAIESGGPPRDGIPAIDEPEFEAAALSVLADDAAVLGISLNGIARAYPVAILNYHEIVNDRFDNQPVVISFCPLCGSGMVFRAPSDVNDDGFGVSGLLYNSDMLLYDRATESLWSQLMAQAVSGPLAGRRLEQLPADHTTWGEWRGRHPQTVVLTEETGYWRNYRVSPYPDYENSENIWFSVSHRDPRYPPKARVTGLHLGGKTLVIPHIELEQAATEMSYSFNGVELSISFDLPSDSVRIFDDNGRQLPSTSSFWFAWMAFYPDSTVFTH